MPVFVFIWIEILHGRMLGGRADGFMIPSDKRLVLLFSRKNVLSVFNTGTQRSRVRIVKAAEILQGFVWRI